MSNTQYSRLMGAIEGAAVGWFLGTASHWLDYVFATFFATLFIYSYLMDEI